MSDKKTAILIAVVLGGIIGIGIIAVFMVQPLLLSKSQVCFSWAFTS